MTTRHTSKPVIGNGTSEESTFGSPENVIGETPGASCGSEGGNEAATADMRDLESKLRELEKEKSAIDLHRNRVEMDIAALQRVMQLIATKNAAKDVVLDLEHA